MGYTLTIMLDDRTWLLIGRKMANEASSQELKELELILRSNPELHFSLQTLTDLWQQADPGDLQDTEVAYARLLSKINRQDHMLAEVGADDFPQLVPVITYPSRTPFYRRTNVIATTLIAAALAAVVWFAQPHTPSLSTADHQREPASEISTRYGSKTNIVLPDGSKVWLNAGSKITYDKDFGENSRDVQLSGEAYFDVVHKASKPFVIHTRAMDIKVLGTEFNVKSYPDDKTTETSLIRGSIEVTLNDRKADRIILKPHEKLVVSNDQVLDSVTIPKKNKAEAQLPLISVGALKYFSLDSTIMETSWVENRLVFEDESFEEIAVRMTRWYGVNFQFKDEEIKQLRFTGNFKDETLEDALKAMKITADFDYSISDNNVTITKH